MVKNKLNNKIKNPTLIREVNEDTNQMKKFFLILLCVAIITLLLYFLTAKYLVKDNFQDKQEEVSEVEFSYDTVNVGNVFNRPYDSYYVFAYDSSSNYASYYATLLSNFKESETPIYFLDLSVELNKKYVKETSNPSASKPSELSLKEPTLILIKDGKISKYYEDISKIEEVLK